MICTNLFLVASFPSFAWYEDGLGLEVGLKCVLVAKSGALARMSFVELFFDDVSVQELTGLLNCHKMQNACDVFNGA